MNTRNDELGLLLSRTYLSLKRETSRMLQQFELTPEQFSLVAELDKQDDVTQKELADVTEREQTTVTKIVDKLVKKGLVSRRHDPHDRRAIRLLITDAGRQLVCEIIPKVDEIETNAYQGFHQEDIKTLHTLIRKLHQNLQ
ncbi:DNA-binding transcriptional regulator, MarR family [Terribacillus aidingensis]|uniref:DNA-binding transcriptional regulator, MarR family n=1 Tax=Terribacillus aidingensis TaxID=586416 RepID=A0A285N8T5_9BACI|nr:MarR family transcriptional regulator [Terribacillus aidingensis]SNZ05718.1 DNA-binding transcriptional regulator, MarR family [Terribacillus aidingensis]